MFVVEGLGYVVFAGGLVLGGFVGCLGGRLLTTLLRLKRRTLVDTVTGMLGFLVGTYVSFLGFSIHEEWYDGKLVSRNVGGLADHLMLVGTVCSLGLVAIIEISTYIWKLLSRRR